MNMDKDSISVDNSEFIPIVVEMVNRGKGVKIKLKGNSMSPFLKDGRDSALLTRIDQELKMNDVVLIQLPDGRYALHRITAIKGDNIQTTGDGNLNADPWVKKDEVLAKATVFYRKGKTEDRADGMKFKIYSRIWMLCKPLRRVLLFIYRRI